MYDVAIIGASLSGCFLALKLAEKGVSVALIDKEKFPRRKPCGEGLSARGVALLNEINLRERILKRSCIF